MSRQQAQAEEQAARMLATIEADYKESKKQQKQRIEDSFRSIIHECDSFGYQVRDIAQRLRATAEAVEMLKANKLPHLLAKLTPDVGAAELSDPDELRQVATMLDGYEDARTLADDVRERKAVARGHIELKAIPKKLASGQVKHYHYYYLRYWEGEKLKSVYLGKEHPFRLGNTGKPTEAE